MAVAEARAAWQRTAHRCFVQEDAKRAPKLAYCQSSSSSEPVDTGSANPADVFDNPAVGVMPVKQSPSSENLPPDLRWWLQMQPDYGHQRGLKNEKPSDLDFDTASFMSGGMYSSDMSNVVETLKNEPNMNGSTKSESSADVTCGRISTASIEKTSEVKRQDMNTVHCVVSPEVSDMSSYYEVLGVDSDCSSTGKQKTQELGLNCETPWIGTRKAEPWWRTTDGDELASLVVQKSLDHIDNCDLPTPQSTNLGWKSVGQFGCFSSNRIVTSSVTKKWAVDLLADPIQVQKNHGIETPYSVQRDSVEHFKLGSNSTSSNSTFQDDIQTTLKEMSLADPSKAQLLEALCHSQTRAREAENAAQQASLEMEHIMNLFFKQASHLFAYKQWFKLLQLEAFYCQLRSKDQPLASIFPAAIPWTPKKARKLKKSWQKKFQGKRTKPGHSRSMMYKYALAVALGLGLVGAGLFIGWSIGWWLFPAI